MVALGLLAAFGIAAFGVTVAAIPMATAQSNAIPDLGLTGFGWITANDDWLQPPPGHGHGPIGDDPAHPFLSSVQASRKGGQPTNRIGNTKDPVLKPWAAAQMLASNEEVLRARERSRSLHRPSAIRAACRANCCSRSSRLPSSRHRRKSG